MIVVYNSELQRRIVDAFLANNSKYALIFHEVLPFKFGLIWLKICVLIVSTYERIP